MWCTDVALVFYWMLTCLVAECSPDSHLSPVACPFSVTIFLKLFHIISNHRKCTWEVQASSGARSGEDGCYSQ